MKIAFLSDTHFTDRAVACRGDDVFQTQYLRFKSVLEYCRAHQIKYLVQAGDFFDHPRVSNRVLAWLIQLIQKYGEITIYAIPGQHDLRNHNYSRWQDDSDLAILNALPNFNVMEPGDIEIIERVGIHFYGFDQKDTAGFLEGKLPTSVIPDFNIGVAHATVGVGASSYWTDVDDCVFHKSFNLAVFGDVHAGIPLQPVGGTQVWNGGVLTPMKRDEPHDSHFLVAKFVANSMTLDVINITDHNVEIVAATEEVVVGEDITAQAFVDGITQARVTAFIDPEKTLAEVAEKLKVEPRVKAQSQAYLHEAMNK